MNSTLWRNAKWPLAAHQAEDRPLWQIEYACRSGSQVNVIPCESLMMWYCKAACVPLSVRPNLRLLSAFLAVRGCHKKGFRRVKELPRSCASGVGVPPQRKGAGRGTRGPRMRRVATGGPCRRAPSSRGQAAGSVARRLASSRSRYFWILPLPVIGKASTKKTRRGNLEAGDAAAAEREDVVLG